MKIFILALSFVVRKYYRCDIVQDPEFPKNEFIMQLRLHNGMVTDFHSAPDLYVGGLQLVPQWTVVENLLRIVCGQVVSTQR